MKSPGALQNHRRQQNIRFEKSLFYDLIINQISPLTSK